MPKNTSKAFDFTYQIRNRAPTDYTFDNQHQSKYHKKEFPHSNQYSDTERQSDHCTIDAIGLINIAVS